jgi:hypothetical protein
VVDREARVGGELGVGGRARNGVGIAVDRDEAAARRQPREDFARVAAAAEGAVDVDAVGDGDERIHRFAQENADVLHGSIGRARA